MARREHKEYRVAVGAEPADRPIAPLRTDLLISPQLFYGQLCFVIKDPVTLRYYRLQPVEHFLVQQFDGARTARDLLAILQQQFPEGSLTVQDVLRFVGMLHESHLLVGHGIGHAEWLTKRRAAAKRKRVLELAQNFLFFKVPLFHPDRLLGFLDKTIGRVLFHKATGILSILLVVVALWHVLMNADRFAQLPYNLLSAQNLVVLYCVFIFTKIFHEFGHGLAAKHFGGEVSSMGVMLFVVTPSFYCDTSDAWMIPSRAARLWINAGGIVVELVLAAMATFVWLNTPPDGLINQIAINVMISCSVATLFFNANPLLRYDGYYFLADLLEIPNLMSKGRQFVGYYLQKYLLGLKPQLPPDSKRARFLVTYALASSVYKWFVVFGIITLLYYFFEGYGMGPIGIFLAVVYVLMTVIWPLAKSMQFLWKQRWDLTKRLSYMGGAAAAGMAVLALVASLPVRNSIREPLVVLSEADESVFVRTPGYVDEVLKDSGDFVKKGEIIVRLRDLALEQQLVKAEGHLAQQMWQAEDEAIKNQPTLLAISQQTMQTYQKQIETLKQEIEELSLRAPIDGVIIREASLHRLRNNFLPASMNLCRVIRTDRLQARISLPQQKAALVQTGMPVRLRLWSNPDLEIRSSVGRISSTVSDQLVHPALGSHSKGEVDVQADDRGQVHSTSRRSTVVIDLPAIEGGFLADGMTGRGEIEFPRISVAGRLWRMLLDSTTPDWHL